jgi:acylphosphatase
VSGERRALRFLVRGRVQGVGFRYFVLRCAREHGVAGWVRNREDGAVEGEAAGAPEALAGFIAELRRGPRGASVAAVETTEQLESPPPGETFTITH